ncbi:Shugoshin 2 [Senna tora]|uniref:Shugoshin 2 n=1 Tax=Senna tora TaxID=362788 RepID=A0A834WNG6_9FABA|nr:Shugoshin 2 [Senna tora]
MAKRSIGSIMRKKLSDITNSQTQTKLPTLEDGSFEDFPTTKDSIEQLLKERGTLLQLLGERNKMIELSGVEMQKLRANFQKLQLQNWNLAQSNSHMQAEINLGRERIRALQHEILCRDALIRGTNLEVEGKVEMKNENNIPLSQEVEERATLPSPKSSNEEKNRNGKKRRNMRSKSTGSTTSTKDTTKNKVAEKRPRLRRHSSRYTTQEHEALEDLFELEDFKNSVTEEEEENFGLRNEGSGSALGRPSRKAAEKVQTYKEIPLNIKMRREE